MKVVPAGSVPSPRVAREDATVVRDGPAPPAGGAGQTTTLAAWPTAALAAVGLPGGAPLRAVDAATCIRNLAASTFDVENALDALVDRGGPIGDALKTRIAAAAIVGEGQVRYRARFAAAAKLAAFFDLATPFIHADGTFDVAALGSAWGAESTALTAALAAAARRDPPVRTNWALLADVVQILGATCEQPRALAIVDAFLRGDALLPRQVDAVDDVKALIPDGHFAGVGIVAIQHLFPTSVAMFEAVIAKGGEPALMFVLGTPYGSNPLVIAVLRLMGIEAEPGRDALGPLMTFAEERARDIANFLARHLPTMLKQKVRARRLLDDGALLQLVASGRGPLPADRAFRAQVLAALRAAFPPDTVAIEQTTRGKTELFEHGGPAYRTLDVAGCDAKAKEGEVIGDATFDAARTALAQRGAWPPARAAAIGAGVVGLNTAVTLGAAGVPTALVDRDAARRERLAAAGHQVHAAIAELPLAELQALLSGTGHTALTGEALVDFDGVVIATSSMAVEGCAQQLRAFRNRPLDAANAFRPINFDGTGHENLHKDQIGVTRGLILGALAQSVDPGPPAFIDIDRDIQAAALRRWRRTAPPVDYAARACATRPDALALSRAGNRARHDEWMAFLSGVERPVCPRPSETRRVPMPYFFGEPDGSVRVVDTSGDGRSRPVALPGAPAAVHDVEQGRGRVVVECISDGQRLAYEVTLADPPRVRCLGPVWHHAAAIKVPRTGPDGMRLKSTQATHAFAAEQGLLVRRGFDGQWATVSVPDTVDLRTAFVRLVREDLALIVERSPARTHLVPLFDSPAARAFAGHAQLPAAFARVEAVSAWSDPGFNVSPVVVLGRDDRGTAICAALLPTPSVVPLELPAGAIFRTLEGDASVPGQFLVGYTLNDEPVVRRTLHRLPVDTLDLARCADPVRQSLLGRVREARTE